MRRNKGLMVALEELDAAAAADAEATAGAEAAAAEGETTAFVDAPEGDVIEMNEAAGEVETVEAEIAQAAETADTLVEILDKVEASVEEGGLTEAGAEGIRVAVEAMCVAIGFPKSVKVFPAMEGFGDKKTRKQATLEAMAGIQDKIKKIWEVILATFNKAVQWVITFYKHVTDAAAGLKARADKIATLAASKSGKATKEGATVKVSGAVGGFGKYLHVDGKVPEGGDFLAAFDKFTAGSTFSNKAYTALATEGQIALSGMLGSIANEGFEGKVADVIKAFNELAVGTKGKSEIAGLDTYEEKLTFGGRSLYTTIVSDGTKVAELAGKMAFEVEKSSTGKTELEGQETVAPLSADDVATLAKAVSTHMGTYASLKTDIDALVKTEKEIKSKVAIVVKEAGKGEEAKAAANSRMGSAVAKAYISACTTGASRLRKYDVSVCKAALDYAAGSLKAVEAPSKEVATA